MAELIPLNYDLHIHSCLSPCGDDDMTPGNIVGMAKLNELDVIALTDHNTARNCPAFLKLAEQFDILAIPGMELTTEEEVHVVCLFPELKAALDFDKYVYEKLVKVENCEPVFGKQTICDENDEPSGSEKMLLINATTIDFDRVFKLADEYGGVAIPAHLDKKTTSLISNLGFIPPDSTFKTAEVKDLAKLHELKKNHPYLEKCRIISSSDAHYLEHIRMKENSQQIYVAERSAKGVIDVLKSAFYPVNQ